MKKTMTEEQAKKFKEAQDYLVFIRSDRCGTLPDFVSRFSELVNNTGFTLADLGTNQKELAYLRRQHHKNEALEWLKGAREHPCDCLDYIKLIRDSLSGGGWTLADIGLTERKLANIEKQMNKQIAISLLQRARANPFDCITARGIEKFVAKAGCTLKDIGTSKKEVDKLSEPIVLSDLFK